MMTFDDAASVFLLNNETGQLIWKNRRGSRAKTGDEAGCISTFGYRYISVNRKSYLAHRIVWLLTTGQWPTQQIDHINGIRTDNRPANLREVTHAENGKNQRVPRDNKSGVMGVHWDSHRQKWVAQIGICGRPKHLGRFSSMEEAVTARKNAERQLGFHPNHGIAP